AISMDPESLGLQDCLQIEHCFVRPRLTVDDDIVEVAYELELLVRDLQPPRDLFVRLCSPGEQPCPQMRELVRRQEDEHCVRETPFDRERTVDFRLHHQVVTLGQRPLDEL